MLFGAAYYPEHWPEERWIIDAGMMKEAGFNVVRMAEFAWHTLQPSENEFDFGWLDSAIDIMGQHGIKTILGTPTAAPPKWLVDRCPRLHMVDDRGHERGFGSRRYYCFNNKQYHEYTKTIVSKMAEHYFGNENIAGWQIDNELGSMNTTRCYCENCRREFISWLKERYETIQSVNEQWGTIFSGQCFNSWDEVILPRLTAMGGHNPSLLLDFDRFSSDSAIRYLELQADILREKTPGQMITTNTVTFFSDIDYYRLFENLDLVSVDIYPNISEEETISPMIPALAHDITRGIKNRNYIVSEHQSGAPMGHVPHRTPRPGDMRRWTFQSLAHGADAIIYFRWRTLPFGIEEYWHGILNHDGLANRRYEEAKIIGCELKKISPYLDGSVIKADVAIIKSYDVEWVFDIQPHAKGYKYIDHLTGFYDYFYKNNIPVDIISPDSDFSRYKLVIAPNLIMLLDCHYEKIHRYVSEGGLLILDFRAGAKIWNNQMTREPLPGRLSSLLGIRICDYGIIKSFEDIKISFEGKNYDAAYWYDVIKLNSGGCLAQFESDYIQGFPAITQNKYGDGNAYYIATEADGELLEAFLGSIIKRFDISPVIERTDGVEVSARMKDGKEHFLIINHNSEPVDIKLNGSFMELLSDIIVCGSVTMEGGAVLMFKKLQ